MHNNVNNVIFLYKSSSILRLSLQDCRRRPRELVVHYEMTMDLYHRLSLAKISNLVNMTRFMSNLHEVFSR